METEVEVGVRPQDLEAARAGEAELTGRVELAETLGSSVLVHARMDGGVSFRLLVSAEAGPTLGEPIGARMRTECLHVFDARTGARLHG